MKRPLILLAILSLAHCGPASTGTGTGTGTAPVAGAPPEPAPASRPPDALVPPQPTLRLPRNFLPSQYTARLAIDPSKTELAGHIAITGEVSERSKVIWLHGYRLKVGTAVATRDGASVALAVTPAATDLLRVEAQQPLAAGTWTLQLDYTGELDVVNTTGAFKQTVGDHAYVYTQLEAIYARRVFPCLDEPDNKVPWKLTFDIPSQLTVVSNTPQVGEAPAGERTKRVEFAQTKPLPSYLVAFGIGPFDIVDAGKTRRGTPVRIVTLAKRAADAAYAAKTSVPILELAEDWFGTPYPYEKLDMLTIPLTVGFGAMENAGLITYTETLMLFDPARSSRTREQRWGGVAAHEIAHQWFGNLVTAKFWDDIWLNEGFASWVGRKITSRFEPAWRTDQGSLDSRNTALRADALVSARKIRQPIERADDVFNAFDRITYDKGASVLAMFEHHLGPDVFQRGVREYLASRAWGNATSGEFVTALGKAAGRDLWPAFATFLEQAGAPEITATLACGSGKPQLALAQQRYVPPGAPTPPPGAPWIVPVCVAYDKDGRRGEACTLLDQPAATLALDAKACPTWVMPNKYGSGYYRSAYTAEQAAALRDQGWPKLTWTERRALHFDLAAAAATGKLPLALSMSLVPKLLAGNDRFSVGPVLEAADELDRVVPDALRASFEQWLRRTFGASAQRAGLVGKPGDTLDVESTRRELITTVAWLGREPKLVAEAVKLADGWRDLPQSIRGTVLKVAVDARPELFERIRRDVKTEPDRSRRQDMFAALAAVRDPGRQAAALSLIADATVDIRETLSMLNGASTDANREVARGYFRDHQDAIMKRVPHAETSSPLARLSALFTATCRADQREAVTAYVKATFAGLPGGARVVRQNLESMDHCIARRKLLEPELQAWLAPARR